MSRLTNHNKEIPTPTPDNAKFWKDVYFKLSEYEDKEDEEETNKTKKNLGGVQTP